MNGYVITDENKTIYVCQDKSGAYSLTTDCNKALVFDTKLAADKVFKSNLSKLIKSKGVVVTAIQSQPADVIQESSVGLEETLASACGYETSKYIVSIISDAVGKLNRRHSSLSEELSRYDRQVSDIHHYIEFNVGKLNARDGYKAYKMLQDVLVTRRKVKDELSVLQVVRDKIAFSEDLENIGERVRELESRQYTPRELPQLFEAPKKNGG